MAQQLLHRANVVTLLQKMGRKRMTKSVAGDALENTEALYRRPNVTLDSRRMI